jgi:LemA protein
MKAALTIFGVIILAVVLLLVAGCGSYNRLNTLKQGVDKSWADVQNVYQRRADLVPNLVQTVQGAANFEQTTLTEVVQARQQVNNVKLDPNVAPTDPAALQRFQQTQDALSGALSRLLVVVEKYPELRATEGFRDLQTQLEGTENRISVERGRFNEAVRGYNTSVESMPTRLYAGMFGYHPRPYFAAREGADLPPPVNFNFGPGATSSAPGTPLPAAPPAAPALER